MAKLLVSIIIPYQAKSEKIDELLKDLSNQKTSFETEIIPVQDVTPAGKARNIGARRAKGEILVFLDSDLRLGHEAVLENLVNSLLRHNNLGIVSGSIRIPPYTSKFQKRYTQEIPHSQTPVVDKLTEVAVATSACCVIYKKLFLEIGGFNEFLPRGQDPELCWRLRKKGYLTALAPFCWCYHPQPDNMAELIRIHFRNGLSTGIVDYFWPDLNIDIDPKGIFYISERKTKSYRIARYIIAMLKAIIRCEILLFSSKSIYLFGYLYGFLKCRIWKTKSAP
ncbi:MAG: glycosyltransferase [Candidatus Omnitrophica bacterium]|nr:glycosyltransferase [Candidatus Omnitrophota bacterium]